MLHGNTRYHELSQADRCNVADSLANKTLGIREYGNEVNKLVKRRIIGEQVVRNIQEDPELSELVKSSCKNLDELYVSC